MQPRNEHTKTVIYLHGANGNSWDNFSMFDQEFIADYKTRVVLPQAPKLTLNAGGEGFNWFNINR